MATYLVIREHLGDKYYSEGETREANPLDVKHLINKGVLVEKTDESLEKRSRATSRSTKVKSE